LGRLLILVLAAALCGAATAQTSPAFPGATADPVFDGDVAREDYLAALQQISPVAREAVEDYLAAYARRCGRAMTTAELRRRVAQGSGDPQLMAMIRATQLRDDTALQRLRSNVQCGSTR
jgi:hypothetical protein